MRYEVEISEQAFRGISHFVWYCKAVLDLSEMS